MVASSGRAPIPITFKTSLQTAEEGHHHIPLPEDGLNLGVTLLGGLSHFEKCAYPLESLLSCALQDRVV